MGFDREQPAAAVKQEPGEDFSAPICVISSVYSATASTSPAEDQKPDSCTLDGDLTRRYRYSINYAESEDEGCEPTPKKRGRGSRGRSHWMSKLAEARHNKSLAEQYWIGCRFCANAYPEKVGLNKVMCHEETEHPEQVESNQKSPFYKIFKVKPMNIDAFPETPLRTKIFAKHPVSLEWPTKPKTSKLEATSGSANGERRGRGRRSDYSEADCICPYCQKVFKYPSFCQQHQRFCSERPGRVLGRGRGPNPTVKVCPHCSHTCVGVSGLMNHFKVCPQRRKKGERPRTSQSSENYQGFAIEIESRDDRERAPRRYGPSPAARLCPNCSQTCVGVAGLMSHLQLCSMRKRKRRQGQRNLGPRTCQGCQRTFPFPSALAQHQRGTCPYNEMRKCPPTLTMTTCPFCRRTYKFPSALWQHLKVCGLAQKAAAAADTDEVTETGKGKGQDVGAGAEGEVSELSLALAALNRRSINISLIPPPTAGTVSQTGQSQSQPQRKIMTTSPVKRRSSLAFLTCELCSHVSLSRMGMINHRHIVHKITTPPIESNTTSEQMEELVEAPNTSSVRTVQAADEEKKKQPEPDPSIRPRDESQPKVYKCLQCYRPFPTRYKLVQHERVHTGEKPYKCPMCSAAFARATTRNTHMNRSHKNTNASKSQQHPSVPDEIIIAKRPGNFHAQAFVRCRFCPLVLASPVGKTLHERYAHKTEFTAAGPDEFTIRKNMEMRKAAFAGLDKSSLTASDAARALSLVKTDISAASVGTGVAGAEPTASDYAVAAEIDVDAHSHCQSDLVIVSQEQEFFMENGESENDVDPLMLPDSETALEFGVTGRKTVEEVQEVMTAMSWKVMKGLNSGPVQRAPQPPAVRFRMIGANAVRAQTREEEPLTLHYDEENSASANAGSATAAAAQESDPFSSLKAPEIEEIVLGDSEDEVEENEMILPTVGDEGADNDNGNVVASRPPSTSTSSLPVSYIVPACAFNTSTTTAAPASAHAGPQPPRQHQHCTYKCVSCGVLFNSMTSLSQHVCIGVDNSLKDC